MHNKNMGLIQEAQSNRSLVYISCLSLRKKEAISDHLTLANSLSLKHDDSTLFEDHTSVDAVSIMFSAGLPGISACANAHEEGCRCRQRPR